MNSNTKRCHKRDSFKLVSIEPGKNHHQQQESFFVMRRENVYSFRVKQIFERFLKIILEVYFFGVRKQVWFCCVIFLLLEERSGLVWVILVGCK